MYVTCLDLEGVLVPEIWIAFAKATGIPELSPFNAQGKRQTSFASCDVMPDIEEDVDVEIRDEDIRIDTYRPRGFKLQLRFSGGGVGDIQERIFWRQ